MKVLSFEGERELVDAARAHELLRTYESERTASTPSLFTHITLRNKSYTIDAARVIAAFFTDLDARGAFAQLTSVDFADMIAGRPEDEALQVLATLCDALRGIKTLTRIDLSDNALGEKGVRACFGLLLGQENLQHVYFCNNGISAAAAAVIADEVLLYRGPDVPTKLETFHFYNNMSGDGGAKAFARLLPRCPLLRDLRFSATRAQREGSLELAKSLRALVHLEKLDLSDNTFGADGGIAIASALTHQPKLVEINLRDATIEDDGMVAIADALEHTRALTALDVSGNELTVTSMRALARALHHLPALRVLQVEENEFGSRGAKALAHGLKTAAPLLEKLIANVNEIGTKGSVAIVQAVADKTALKTLEIDGNMIASEGVETIEALLEAKGKSDALGSLEDNDDEGEAEDDDEEEEAQVVTLPPPAPVSVDALAAALDKSLQIAAFAFKSTQREVVDDVRARALLVEAGVDPEATTPLRFTSISLRGKSYTDSGAALLATAFLGRLEAPFLKVVDLADVIAGRPEDEALRVLTCMSNALVGHTLEEIDLSDNALGEKGVRACFALLLPQPHLRRLLFCNNGISAAAATVIAQEIVLQNGPDALSSLHEFHFYNNMSGHDGALAIAQVLKQCPRLRVLRFASARAGLEASEQLAVSVGAHLRDLTSLDLSDCSFEESGAEALATAIARQRQLTHLKLRDASLGAEGATQVLEAANAAGLELVELDLSGNELADDGMETVAALLTKQTKLQTLRLDENEVTSDGLCAFVRIVKGSLSNLRELSLCGNEITAKGARAVVEDLVPTLSQLVKLELDANMISDKGVATIESVLAAVGKRAILGSLQDNDGDDESDDE